MTSRDEWIEQVTDNPETANLLHDAMAWADAHRDMDENSVRLFGKTVEEIRQMMADQTRQEDGKPKSVLLVGDAIVKHAIRQADAHRDGQEDGYFDLRLERQEDNMCSVCGQDHGPELACGGTPIYGTGGGMIRTGRTNGVLSDEGTVLKLPSPTPPPREQGDAALLAEIDQLKKQLNTPEILDFAKAVNLEAAHQRERWGTDHDGGKEDADWFWLVGYLAGKALHVPEKRLHHLITAAAALANWHLYTLGKTNMRPGIETPTERPTMTDHRLGETHGQ